MSDEQPRAKPRGKGKPFTSDYQPDRPSQAENYDYRRDANSLRRLADEEAEGEHSK